MPCGCLFWRRAERPAKGSNRDLHSNHYAPPITLSLAKSEAAHGVDGKNNSNKIHITEEEQECSVCYEALCDKPTAVFVKVDGKTRPCSHYFHAACARELLDHAHQMTKENEENETTSGKSKQISAACPICRVPVYGCVNVPSCKTNPDLWFDIVDVDRDGKVSPADLVTILRAQFLVDWRTIEKKLTTEIWPKYDAGNEGFISRDLLLKPGGLLDFLLNTFEMRKRRYRNCPNLEHSPKKWFEYWDEDKSGSLDMEELIRALVKTFNLGVETRSLRGMADSVRAVWCAFDQDQKGEITLEEFTKREGLAQSIIATIRWSESDYSTGGSREHSRISGADPDMPSQTRSHRKKKRVGLFATTRFQASADEDDINNSPRDSRLTYLASDPE